MAVSDRAGRSVLDYEVAELMGALSLGGGQETTRNGNDWVLPVPSSEHARLGYLPQEVAKEAQRLKVLREYKVLETDKEEVFDVMTRQVAENISVPWAIISFVDMGRQWFKSVHKPDLEVGETARKHSFCTHAIQNKRDVFVITDATQDERFSQNPFVTGNPGFRFYSSVPLEVPEGVRLGTLCVLDRQPRPQGLAPQQEQFLKDVAKQVVDQLVSRKQTLLAAGGVEPERKRQVTAPSPPPSPRRPTQKHTITKTQDELVASDHKKSRRGPRDNTPVVIPKPLHTVLLPDPKTEGMDPDTYLGQLVEAVYGAKLQLKTAIELGDYFPEITDDQISAYSMEVVSLARTNNTQGLKDVFQAKGREALDCFNRFGEGLLNLCCRRGFTETVSFLLSSEVKLNVRVRDDFGRTPLHDCCWNPEPLVEIAHKLMEQDPSLFFITDKRGYTPFQYARKTDWPLWRQFLFERRHLLAPLASKEIQSRFS